MKTRSQRRRECHSICSHNPSTYKPNIFHWADGELRSAFEDFSRHFVAPLKIRADGFSKRSCHMRRAFWSPFATEYDNAGEAGSAEYSRAWWKNDLMPERACSQPINPRELPSGRHRVRIACYSEKQEVTPIDMSRTLGLVLLELRDQRLVKACAKARQEYLMNSPSLLRRRARPR